MSCTNSKKIAFITGSSRGIGYGIAQELNQEGFVTVMSGTSTSEKVAEAVQSLPFPENSLYIQGDISNAQDRRNFLDTILSSFGRIDLLVNNAGVAPSARLDILQTTEESYDRVMGINLKSMFFLTQLFANSMIQLKTQLSDYCPRIVNISSMSSFTSSTNRGEYCISKAGISMVTMLFADKLAETGIPVFEIQPGIIATDMTSGVKEKYDKMISEGITPIRRWGTPKDIADAVSVCASGKLDFATGQVLHVDGGFHIQRL
jgi:NAD(P)-dependent dehydrogenase (short-subunit alcohol dehydrogenase family)